MLTNSNDRIKTFAGGHCATSSKIWKHFSWLINPWFSVIMIWKCYKYGTLLILIAVLFCAVESGFCFLTVDCGQKKGCQILEVLAYPRYLTINCLSRNIKVEGSKLVNVKHQKSILLERCLCALSIGDFAYVL